MIEAILRRLRRLAGKKFPSLRRKKMQGYPEASSTSPLPTLNFEPFDYAQGRPVTLNGIPPRAAKPLVESTRVRGKRFRDSCGGDDQWRLSFGANHSTGLPSELKSSRRFSGFPRSGFASRTVRRRRAKTPRRAAGRIFLPVARPIARAAPGPNRFRAKDRGSLAKVFQALRACQDSCRSLGEILTLGSDGLLPARLEGRQERRHRYQRPRVVIDIG